MYTLKWAPKALSGQLVPFLRWEEVRCKCNYDTCTRTLINERTANSFYLTRRALGSPITITSGYRCDLHNIDIGGIPNSFHKIGCALDLKHEDLDLLEEKCKLYFDVVIRYKKFIHCHNEY
jgi:hypothetical protein